VQGGFIAKALAAPCLALVPPSCAVTEMQQLLHGTTPSTDLLSRAASLGRVASYTLVMIFSALVFKR
jgi:hypothetical protein